MGRRLRSPLDRIHPQYCPEAPRTAAGPTRKFQEGDWVYAENFSGDPSWVPAKVLSCTGPKSYRVEVEGGDIWKRHIDQLRNRRRGETERPKETSEDRSQVEDFPWSQVEDRSYLEESRPDKVGLPPPDEVGLPAPGKVALHEHHKGDQQQQPGQAGRGLADRQHTQVDRDPGRNGGIPTGTKHTGGKKGTEEQAPGGEGKGRTRQNTQNQPDKGDLKQPEEVGLESKRRQHKEQSKTDNTQQSGQVATQNTDREEQPHQQCTRREQPPTETNQHPDRVERRVGKEHHEARHLPGLSHLGKEAGPGRDVDGNPPPREGRTGEAGSQLASSTVSGPLDQRGAATTETSVQPKGSATTELRRSNRARSRPAHLRDYTLK